jgi:hypothetical protein
LPEADVVPPSAPEDEEVPPLPEEADAELDEPIPPVPIPLVPVPPDPDVPAPVAPVEDPPLVVAPDVAVDPVPLALAVPVVLLPIIGPITGPETEGVLLILPPMSLPLG